MKILKRLFFCSILGFALFAFCSEVFASGLSKPSNNLGLVGYWSMDDGVGTKATDFSGKGNTGTLTGSPPWVSGKRGKALQFSGTSKYVCAGDIDAMDGVGALTVSGWFNASAWNNQDWVAQKGSVFFLGRADGVTSANGGFAVSASGGWKTANFPAAPSLNVWHHIVGVYASGTNVLLYLDGSLVTTGDVAGGLGSTSQHFCIGGDNDNNFSMDGIVDELRVYNRALAAPEITTLYNAGAVRAKPANNLGLMGYWSFEDGVGTKATDFSGKGNTATLVNMEAGDWIFGKRGKALQFDGVNEYVSSTLDGTTLTEFTTSFWFNQASSTQLGLFQWANELGDTEPFLAISNGSELRFYADGNFRATGIAAPLNEWVYITVTLNASNLWTFYVNNVAYTYQDDATHSFQSQAATIFAGNAYWGYLPGKIDELRIYNRALTAIEVTALYNAGVTKVGASLTGPAPSNLVLWHTFDGPYLTQTTSIDKSGTGNDGTLAGASGVQSKPQPTLSKVGQGLKLDGTDDYISVPDHASLNMTSYLSICAWIYPDTWVGKNARIVQKGGDADQYRFLSESGNFVFEVGDDYLQVTSTIPPAGQWHHVCGVYDGATMKIYKNGVEAASAARTGAIGTSAGALYIGTKNGGAPSSDIFEGRLDDLRIYNKGLTPAEVMQLYRLGR